MCYRDDEVRGKAMAERNVVRFSSGPEDPRVAGSIPALGTAVLGVGSGFSGGFTVRMLVLLAAIGCGKKAPAESAPSRASTQTPVRRVTAAELVRRLPPTPLLIGLNRIGTEQEILDFFAPPPTQTTPRKGPAPCLANILAHLDAAAFAVRDSDGSFAIVASGPGLRSVTDACLREGLIQGRRTEAVDEADVTRYTADNGSTYAVWEGSDTVVFGGAENPEAARILARTGGATVPTEVDASSLVWGADVTTSSGFQDKLGLAAASSRRAWFSAWTGERAGIDLVVQMSSPAQVEGTIAVAAGGAPVQASAVVYQLEADGDRLVVHMDMDPEIRHAYGEDPNQVGRNLIVAGGGFVLAAPHLRRYLAPGSATQAR